MLSRCLAQGMRLKLVHTPGKLLNRPDSVSRGVMPAEPRQRVIRSVFRELSAKFGLFESFLGAEREFAAGGEGRGESMWLHPSYDTVGSALRLLGSLLTTDPATCPRGLMLVPWAPEAR